MFGIRNQVGVLTLVVLSSLISACGGGGSGGGSSTTTVTNNNTTTPDISAQTEGSLMAWNDSASVTASDQYAQGKIGTDGSAMLVWAQSTASGDYNKAYASYYSPNTSAWSGSTLLDTGSSGVQASVWNSGVQNIGAIDADLGQDLAGNWNVWWRYCQKDFSGLCTNASSVNYQGLTSATGVWSAYQAGLYSVAAQESFRVLRDKFGNQWLSTTAWVAKAGSDGALTGKTDIAGTAFLDSAGNVLVFSAADSSIYRYDRNSALWTSYALYSTGTLHSPQALKFFEHAAGKVSVYWQDAADVNTVRLWVTTLDSTQATVSTKTASITSGVSAFFGQMAAADSNGVTILSASSGSAARTVTAQRYDLAKGSVVSSVVLETNAPISHSSPIALRYAAGKFFGVWESRSISGRVSIKAAVLNQDGSLNGSVQEPYFYESGTQDVTAMVKALWVAADGKLDVVWRLYGSGVDVWQSSVCATSDGANWSAGKAIQASTSAGSFSASSLAEVPNSAGETAGVWFHGLGVAVLALDENGHITKGTQALPWTLVQSSDYMDSRLLDNGIVAVLGKNTSGAVWYVRSQSGN